MYVNCNHEFRQSQAPLKTFELPDWMDRESETIDRNYRGGGVKGMRSEGIRMMWEVTTKPEGPKSNWIWAYTVPSIRFLSIPPR